MRRAIRMGALTLLGGCVLTCGLPVGANPARADAVTLTMYVHSQYGVEGQNYYNNVVVKPYEQSHPNVTIKVIFTAQVRDVDNQQLAAGGGPDLLVTDGTADVAKYASANDAIPLTKYAAKYGWNTRFAAWTYPTITYHGTLYAVPDKADALFMFYNKTLFKQNGWHVPQDYAQLAALCKAIAAKHIIPLALGTADIPNANEWYLSSAINATLGIANERKLFQGALPWNGALMTDAVSKLTALWQSGYINDKQSSAVRVDDMANEFRSGKAAMDLGGSFTVPNFLTTKPAFDWGIFEMPGWRPGVGTITPVGVGQTYLINAHSKNADAAAAFLDWREQPAVLMQGINAIGVPPLRTLDLSLVHGGLDAHWNDALALLGNAVAHGSAGYVSWSYWPASTRVYALNNIDAMWQGQISLKTFMDQLQATFLKDKHAGVYSFS